MRSAELFADIYRQCFGETADDETILADAEQRKAILAGYRKGRQ